MLDFSITEKGIYSDLFREKGIHQFSEACAFVQALPYGRNSKRDDFRLILTEGKGACSGKHALLAHLALEQGHPEVEIIAGIFLMNGETHPVLSEFFRDKPYTAIPECHCYLRYNGERYDYTAPGNGMERIAPKIVREQRIDPHQVVEWKPNMHKHYMESWLKRKPDLAISFDELWNDREACIQLIGLQ